MILKGSQRGNGRNLAAHLLDGRDNDHVSKIDLRGTAADDLRGALLEIEATAHGTKCQQPFFHVIFNPPEHANLTREQFAAAFDKLEADMGLADQPRAVVFHEKNGREHAHAVYGRLYESHTYEHGAKAGQPRAEPVLKAKQLSYFKQDLRRISQDLHTELGLEMPAGLKDSRQRDPLNFEHKLWQQAKRIDEDPRDLKKIITEAYKFADNAQALNAALEQNAMQLACGDRRGFVVVHHTGEALPLHRVLDAKQGDIRARLGQPEHVQTVDQARTTLTDKMTAQAERQFSDVKRKHQKDRLPMADAVKALRAEQQKARHVLAERQEKRQGIEAKDRAGRIRTGIMGLFDRLQLRIGRGPLARQFADEVKAGQKRDGAEFHELKTQQHRERQQLQKAIKLLQQKQRIERERARIILGHWLSLDRGTPRRRIEDHLAEQDQSRQKYTQERGDFGKATDRRAGKGRSLGLKLKPPKGPSPRR